MSASNPPGATNSQQPPKRLTIRLKAPVPPSLSTLSSSAATDVEPPTSLRINPPAKTSTHIWNDTGEDNSPLDPKATTISIIVNASQMDEDSGSDIDLGGSSSICDGDESDEREEYEEDINELDHHQAQSYASSLPSELSDPVLDPKTYNLVPSKRPLAVAFKQQLPLKKGGSGRGRGRKRTTGPLKTVRSIQNILEKAISSIRQRDTYGCFLEPVDLTLVTDYLLYIKRPMDLQTMYNKVQGKKYLSFKDFRDDFDLIIKNAKTYNAPGTVFYKAAERLESRCKIMLDRDAAIAADSEQIPYFADSRENNSNTDQIRGEAGMSWSADPSLYLDPQRLVAADMMSVSNAAIAPLPGIHSKNSKQTERLESMMAESFLPTGAARVYFGPESGGHGTAIDERLASYSEEFTCALNPTPISGVPNRIYDYGTQRDMPSSSLPKQDACRALYGDNLGQSYVDSLKAFSKEIQCLAVTNFIRDKITNLSGGGEIILSKVEEYQQVSVTSGGIDLLDQDRWTVPTPMGTADLTLLSLPRIDQPQSFVTSTHPEVQRVLKGPVDMALVSVAVPGSRTLAIHIRPDEVLTSILLKNVPVMQKLQDPATVGDGGLCEEDRKALLESVRVRLLASIQKVAGVP